MKRVLFSSGVEGAKRDTCLTAGHHDIVSEGRPWNNIQWHTAMEFMLLYRPTDGDKHARRVGNLVLLRVVRMVYAKSKVIPPRGG